MRFSFILFLLVLQHNNSAAQEINNVDTSFTSYFEKLPAIQNSAEEAWKVYLPKKKLTATKQFAAELQTQLNILADRSDHKSYLLSWLSERIDKESSRYKLSEVKIQKDKVLEKAVTEANTAYFSLLDDYMRVINHSFDSLIKNYTGSTLAEKQLQLYQKQVPLLYNKTKIILNKVQQVLQAKGYNKILQQGKTDHPYFVQLLETRGIFFDRLRELNQQADAGNMAAAETMDYCKKDPVNCK